MHFALGRLELDGDGRLLSFGEKSAAGPGWINGGVYVMEPDILDHIPAGRPVSIERETFPHALAQGRTLYSYPVTGFFVDIGTPEGYRRFCEHIREGGHDRTK